MVNLKYSLLKKDNKTITRIAIYIHHSVYIFVVYN